MRGTPGGCGRGEKAGGLWKEKLDGRCTRWRATCNKELFPEINQATLRRTAAGQSRWLFSMGWSCDKYEYSGTISLILARTSSGLSKNNAASSSSNFFRRQIGRASCRARV